MAVSGPSGNVHVVGRVRGDGPGNGNVYSGRADYAERNARAGDNMGDWNGVPCVNSLSSSKPLGSMKARTLAPGRGITGVRIWTLEFGSHR